MQKRLENVRDLRNQSVHSGFRAWDISRKELLQYDQITTLSCPRVLFLLEQALNQGITNIAEFDEYFKIKFKQNIQCISKCINLQLSNHYYETEY